jgi:phosphoribosylglycinamide formyltransferase 1
MKNIAVFASGYGSNFMKIHENTLNGKIQARLAFFVSDQPEAHAVLYAKKHQIPSFIFHATDYTKKSIYEDIILSMLRTHQVDVIVLAGYMRKIGHTLLDAYANRIINIHPSLLPLFKGKDAIRQAWESKVPVTGVTIHYVDEEIDHGTIIMQESIVVTHPTIEALTEDMHQIEHRLYTEAIRTLLEDMK